jgi:hypothetical protein
VSRVNAFTFWSEHPPREAFEIANGLLGTAVLCRECAFFKGHNFLRISYSPDFDLAGVEKRIREELDGIEWLFLTTGQSIQNNGQTLPTFGMAPMLPRKLEVGYHATRACLVPKICGEQGEGLLPSNAERRATHFPDTNGVIHVCERLSHKGEQNDSAQWWMMTLSKRNNFNDSNWSILRIDMTQLPATARVYQDMHSASGVIVDRIERIPGRLITEVPVVARQCHHLTGDSCD